MRFTFTDCFVVPPRNDDEKWGVSLKTQSVQSDKHGLPSFGSETLKILIQHKWEQKTTFLPLSALSLNPAFHQKYLPTGHSGLQSFLEC